MRQALSVLVMRMVTYNETLQVRRLLSSENGHFCLDLSELLREGSPLDVLTGRSYHGQDISAFFLQEHGKLVDYAPTTRKREKSI